MKIELWLCVLAACLMSSPIVAHAQQWQATEKVQTYAISGKSGAELYASIGQRGPKIGIVRAIAHTDFKLTWSRKYVPQNGGCTLVSARPNLVITYMLPKPDGSLPAATRKNWETFANAVHAHELVHGDFIKEMVSKIEAVSVGLSVADDPKCSKIRTELTQHLGRLSLAQRQQSRDFDRTELSEGGNIHQLVLKLVNGP